MEYFAPVLGDCAAMRAVANPPPGVFRGYFLDCVPKNALGTEVEIMTFDGHASENLQASLLPQPDL